MVQIVWPKGDRPQHRDAGECIAEMRDFGLDVSKVAFDGQFKRCRVLYKNHNRPDGWYVATKQGDFLYVIYGIWGDVSRRGRWVSNEREWQVYKRSSAYTDWQQKVEIEQKREQVERFQGFVNKVEAADDDKAAIAAHPYIVNKGIDVADELRRAGEQLLVPMRNLMDELVGVQVIHASGAKKFLPGSKAKNSFMFIGCEAGDIAGEFDRIIICEGMATGTSLYMATGLPVVCVFSATFALSSVQALRSANDQAQFIIALDNDKNYVGQKTADKIVQTVPNCVSRTPSVTGDYNDLHMQFDLSRVRREVLSETFGVRGHTARDVILQPDPPAWIAHGLFETGKAGVLAGVGGIGKSMEALHLGLQIAQGGGQWMGHDIVKSGNVVYVSAEDDRVEINRRVWALDPAGKRFTADHDVYFVTVPDMEKPVTFLSSDSQAAGGLTGMADELIRELEAVEDLTLVVLDPVQAFVSAPISKDNEAGQLWAQFCGHIASKFDCAVLSVHHMSKVAVAGNMSAPEARAAIRGATSLVDGHRFAMALWGASEAEVSDVSTLYGLTPPDPNRVAKFAMVKANGAGVDRSEKTLFRRNAHLEVVPDMKGNQPTPKKPEGGRWGD